MKAHRAPLAILAGGAGFIGTHLCERLLSEGVKVVCLDSFRTGRLSNISAFSRNPRFDLVEADIIDPLPKSLLKLKPDYIFNLACAASPPHYQADPEHTLLTSVVGTHSLLSFAEQKGARMLLASTSEVYGDPEVHPQRESYWGHVNPTGPRACYDEGKRAAETLCFDFLRAGRVDVRVARIFNTYGPKMRADDGRVVSNVITQALTEADITVYGSGEQTRSFCYVDDLVSGLSRLMMLGTQVTEPVNLGNPNEMKVSELVTKVLALTGSRSRIVSRPLPLDDPQRRRPDITRAMQVLNWSPKTPLEQGLKATIAYFEAELAMAQVDVVPSLEEARAASVSPAE